MISLRPCLTPYDWLLYRTLNIPIDELTWETCFHSDIFRTTDWYARVTCGVYRTSRDWFKNRWTADDDSSWYIYSPYVMNYMFVSRVVYTVRHVTDICMAITSRTVFRWWLLSLPLFSLCQGWGAARNFFTDSSDSIFHPPLSLVFFQSSSSPAFFTSLLSPLVSHLVSLVSSCPPHVTLPRSSAVCHPPSFLRVLPTVVCSSPDSLSSSSALPFLPMTPPFFSTFRMT